MEKFIEIKGMSDDFVPKHIFECGQVFRFTKENDGSYTVVAKNRVINVSSEDEKIIIKNTTDEEFSDIWYDYFDLGTDYKKIKEKLSCDIHLKKSSEFGKGIRILHQDLFECIISFIISANNNIPRIQGIIERFAREIPDTAVKLANEFWGGPLTMILKKKKVLLSKKSTLIFPKADMHFVLWIPAEIMRI